MAGQDETDVLIVGAGPVGLVLAVELARRDVRCRLVDRATQPFGGSRADGLQPRTLEILADLGIVATVLAEGNAGIEVRGYSGTEQVWAGRTTEPMPARPDTPYPDIWFLPQFRTEQLLRDRLAALGRHVERGRELVDFRQDADGVTAVLTGPTGTAPLRARYLVGADGGHSVVRKRAGIAFDGETDDAVTALFADVRVEGLDRAFGRVWTNGDATVALMPLSGTDLFTMVAPAPDGDATVDYLRRELAEATGDASIRLLDLTWSTTWRANARLAARFRDRRVFLAGDAAHVCPPTGGQGMNTGIGDAYNLGWKLAAALAGAPDELLDSYAAERVPAARAALALAAELLAKHQRGDEDAHVRGAEVHQLGLNYRGGPLSVDLRPTTGALTAGDRAPDWPLADGTLFDLLHGPQWTALVFGDTDADRPPSVRAHPIADERARQRYQVDAGTVVLVRPDGYVGLVGTSAHDVTDYLKRVT